ncbi:type IV secretory system conjugative DNA transfer family protein [Acidiphilium acidophilum]|uniref:type IV secretory system conjugative DNA transfer family protein n=1 Tax=Acidiphilium acidophilum TaxID=76588 RepID=UPI002E8E761B|nr:type IV secretory system conjugative DNA transfer family protein [Acidiphilium acidophilum]
MAKSQQRSGVSVTGQSIPGYQAMRAYRASYLDAAFIFGIGAAIGNFAAGTVAGAMLHTPWWFGKPFLPAKLIGIPIYSIVPVIVTGLEHYRARGALTSIYAAAGVFAACTIPLAILGLRKAAKVRARVLKSDLHGSAHWADKAEIELAGLLPGDSKSTDNKHICYVGGWTDPKTKRHTYLQHSGPEHIIVHAPTRSGKGVGLVIPTLLAWRGSVLVQDIKGENHALTSGWRASVGQRVLRFSPTESAKSCHFNPLDEIRIRTDHEVKDVQNIATMIVDPDGKGLNDHWQKTGFALLVSAILHILYCPDFKLKTLRAVGSLLSNPDIDQEEGVDQIFTLMKEYKHDPEGSLGWTDHNGKPTCIHPVIAESAQEMINKADNEKSGVISTMMSFLSLYRDPQVAATIAYSDLKIVDLMNADQPISLYLVVPPSDKDRLKPLIRLILNQVIRRLTEDMEFKDGRSVAKYKHRLLLMIDEFPALGKLDVFEEALAFIAGYGMKAYLICQDTSQLYKAYTPNESITSNCHIRIYYAPNRIETAKHISEQLGKFTITTESQNTSYAGGNVMPYQTGSSGGLQHLGRELLTPDEVSRLRGPEKDGAGNIKKAGEMIVTSAGHPPILGTQILYFMDPIFNRRSRIPAPGVVEVEVSAPGVAAQLPEPAAIPPVPKAAVEAGPAAPVEAKLDAPIEVKPDSPAATRPVPQPVITREMADLGIDRDDLASDHEAIDDDEESQGEEGETEFDDGLPHGLGKPDDGLPEIKTVKTEPDEDDQDSDAEVEAELEALADQAAALLEGVNESRETFIPSDTSRHRKADREAFAGLV